MWRTSVIVLWSIGVALLGAVASSAAADDGAFGSKPNIVFIFSDDQSYQTIAEHGFDEVHTPYLDRLARTGTTFSHAYNMGSWSGAVCIASRMMLNSGRSVWRAQQAHAAGDAERKAGRWWSEYMKAAGYRTYMTGKWHTPANVKRSFDVVRDPRPGMPPDTPAAYSRPPAAGADPWSPADAAQGGYWKGGKHWSEVVGDHGVAFLEQAAAEDAPFFMYLAFNAPHDPRQSPQRFVDRYGIDTIGIPANFQPSYPFADAIGCGERLRDERLAPFPRTADAVARHRQEYFAIITHMDEQVGRILDALAASGKADNTWIFFTSDHGLAVGQHGLMGKQNQYDHSVRVPFMIAGPGVEPGKVIDEPIYLQDVMPTTLALAGIAHPDHVEFQNLLPLLRGEPSHYEAIYGSYLQLQRSIRTRRHKLIVYPAAKIVRLFDLEKDPAEQWDLAGQPSSKGLIRELFTQLLDLQRQFDDPLELTSVFPELAKN